MTGSLVAATCTAFATAAAPAFAAVSASPGEVDLVPQTQYWVLGGAVAFAVAVCVYVAVGFVRTDRRFKEQERRQEPRAAAAAGHAAAPRSRAPAAAGRKPARRPPGPRSG